MLSVIGILNSRIRNSNLRFARKENKRVEEGFRWKRRPQRAHQSSLRVYQGQEQQIVGYLERYQVKVV